MKKLTSLSFACGTLVTQKDIDSIYEEAYEYPAGRTRNAFLSYASYLEEKLKQQNKTDGLNETKKAFQTFEEFNLKNGK